MASEEEEDYEIVNLAWQMFKQDGIRPRDIGKHLSSKLEVSKRISMQFMKHFNFLSMGFEAALRLFLLHVCLIGEAQQKMAILEKFSTTYYNELSSSSEECVFGSSDCTLALVVSVVLLNTDLHHPNISKHMTKSEFVKNNRKINDGHDFPLKMLKDLYVNVKKNELEMLQDPEICTSGEESLFAPLNANHEAHLTSRHSYPHFSTNKDQNAQRVSFRPPRIQDFIRPSKSFSTSDIVEFPSIVAYESLLAKKDDMDEAHKKASKRQWKNYVASLDGADLLFHKSVRTVKRRTSEKVFIRHGFALIEAGYNKRPHVFRLQLANGRSCLLAADSETVMMEWIRSINYVAAMESSPPLTGAVMSSTVVFHRPIFPITKTCLGPEAQLARHMDEVKELEAALEAHLIDESCPDGVKGKYWADKKAFLEMEISRYSAYVIAHKESQTNLNLNMIELTRKDGLNMEESAKVEKGELMNLNSSTGKVDSANILPPPLREDSHKDEYDVVDVLIPYESVI